MPPPDWPATVFEAGSRGSAGPHEPQYAIAAVVLAVFVWIVYRLARRFG